MVKLSGSLISQRTFLTLNTFNLRSNCTRGQTSRSVTHPHNTPVLARLTSPFLPDELPRKKLYLVDNTTISIILTLIPLCYTSLFFEIPNNHLRKWLFGATKRKTSSCNIVRHPKMHMCAQYGHIITNYAAILAITLVVWTESHETSNMIAHF